MKRIIVKATVFLVLGALINVTVAWGCAIGFNLDLTHVGVGMVFVRAQDEKSLHLGTGLPEKSMWGREWEGYVLKQKFPQNLKAILPVPSKPIWPGFAINTLFYVAILWLLFVAPGRIRRWRRIKRGLCPACAYPVGESATCTDCGRALRVITR